MYDVATESFYLRSGDHVGSLASPYIDDGGLGFIEKAYVISGAAALVLSGKKVLDVILRVSPLPWAL